MIADEPADNFQYLCLLDKGDGPDGDRCYDAVARRYRQNPSCRILLVEPRILRLVEVGVLPSFDALSRRELGKRGLPLGIISLLPSDGGDYWAAARTLRAWLADRPNATVLVFCGRFSSAHLRSLLNLALGSAQAARVRLQALPSRRYDETDWWTSRSGIKGFGIEVLRQLCGWCAGGDHPPWHPCSADDYERHVRQALLEAAP